MTTILANDNILNDYDYYEDFDVYNYYDEHYQELLTMDYMWYGELNGEDFKDTRSIRQAWFRHKDTSTERWEMKHENPCRFVEFKSWKKFDRRKMEKGSTKRRANKLF